MIATIASNPGIHLCLGEGVGVGVGVGVATGVGVGEALPVVVPWE